MKSITELAGAVQERVRGTESREQTDGPETARRDGSQSDLFHCPACDLVYVATDKDTCSGCDAAVEQVPSTLTDAP